MSERRRDCIGCDGTFDEADTVVARHSKAGVSLYLCIPCMFARKTDGLVRLQHDRDLTSRMLLSTYGITIEQYEQMYAAQDGKCAICGARPGRDRRLAVDHNHKTGEVRGLLCHRCNTALGLLRDKRRLLTRALAYLIRPPAREALGRRSLSRDEYVQAQIAERLAAKSEGRRPRPVCRWTEGAGGSDTRMAIVPVKPER